MYNSKTQKDDGINILFAYVNSPVGGVHFSLISLANNFSNFDIKTYLVSHRVAIIVASRH